MRHRGIIVTAWLCASATTASAQVKPEAEQLFREGKRLLKDGKLTEACEAFEASERAEHSTSTLANLADCHDKAGQHATAWALFLRLESELRADTTQKQLHATAKTRSAALEPKLSFLTINVPNESRVDGLVIVRDGQEVDPAIWNRAMPVDGGTHVVSGKAPGHETWSTTIELAPSADRKNVEVPRFKSLAELVQQPAKPDADTSEVEDDGEDDDLEDRPSTSRWTTRRKIAVGVGAFGVAAAGVSLGLGIRARSLHDDAIASCPAGACGEPNLGNARSLQARAEKHALMANIGYGIAGAAVVTGVVLWVTGKPSSTVQSVALRPVVGAYQGFAFTGAF